MSHTYNILLLGPSQAGKSTFLEGIKRYIDPECEIDEDSMGIGHQSCTKEVREQLLETAFPVYQLFDHAAPNSVNMDTPVVQEVNITEIFDDDMNAYKRRIDQVKRLKVHRDDSAGIPTCTIRVFDTPGLDDTNGQDERNVAKILTALSEAGSVHLVLILINRHTPLNEKLKEALQIYSDIFSAMGSLMAFVHTNFEYKIQHFKNKKMVDFMAARKDDLKLLMGRDIPHFLIDLDLDEERPVPAFLTRRVIRHILLLARLNIAVPVSSMQICKTPKMKDLDKFILDECEKKLRLVESQASLTDRAITNIDFSIQQARYEIRELEEYLKNHDTEDLELVYEERYEQDWDLFSIREKKAMEFSNVHFTIDDIRVESQAVDVDIDGGRGCSYWSARITRRFCHEGLFHVKIYVKRRNKYRLEITKKETKLMTWKNTLEDRLNMRLTLDGPERPSLTENDALAIRQVLKREQNECLDMIKRATRLTMHLKLFTAIAEAGQWMEKKSFWSKVKA
ncbi:hypothetical protein BGX28_003930 [Mortierella sp. GBA30]|nr:hypothetical protein BGX28_003930 [Mortierella sp. GBA30]